MSIKSLKSAKVIFWDFDGVIKDSVKVKTDAFEKLFSTYGNDIVKKIRGPNYNTINPNIKIIFMSADISGTTKSELEGKVDLYLPKPIDMDIISRPNLEKLYTK